MSQFSETMKMTSDSSQMDTTDSKGDLLVEGSLEQSIRIGVAHVRVRECCYTWKIMNMSFNLRAFDDTEYTWSPKFQAGTNDEYVFRLLLFPGGCSDEHQDNLCLEIQNFGETTINESQIYVELSLVNNNGEECCKKHEMFHPLKGKLRFLFHSFMNKLFLLDPGNGLLQNDQVILKCRMYFDSKVVERFIADSEVKEEDIKPDCRLREFDEFEQMLENGVFSDARLRADGIEFRVHRAVLAARSRVFSEMMSQAVKIKPDDDFVVIDVQEVNAAVLREVLRFVYAGKVNEIENVAKDLLVAANKFELEGLKMVCEETLIRGLAIENVGEMLAFADKHKTELLAKSAMEFFTLNAKRVVDTDDFLSSMKTCPIWIVAMVKTLVQKLNS